MKHLAVQDESSLAGHLGERAPRTADDEGADVAEDTAEDAVDVPEDADGSSTGAHEPSFLITGPHLWCLTDPWSLRISRQFM